MKQLLGTDTAGSYTFNPGAKTVTFSGLARAITLSNILLITNVTRNTIIYNFADTATGATNFNNNTLTLTYDTTSHSASDVLQIFLDVESKDESLHDLLRRMNKILESNSVVDLNQRQRITIDAIRQQCNRNNRSGRHFCRCQERLRLVHQELIRLAMVLLLKPCQTVQQIHTPLATQSTASIMERPSASILENSKRCSSLLRLRHTL
jgi:hypothetical protein